jgi:Ca2+-binding EF-hand superfamily protein
MPASGKRRLARRFSCALLVLGASVAQAQVADTGSYLQSMDSDGDGRVSVEEYVQWMMYAFERMDRNGDGVLGADELPGGKGSPITREQQRQTLIQRFRKQDANGDGYLSAKELAAPPR